MASFTFQTASPESQGVPSGAVQEFIEKLSGLDSIHSVMMLRHDRLIAQTWWKPFAPEYKHELFSVSKSFVSAAVGIAQGEGFFTLKDKLVDFFPEKLNGKVSERMRKVTLRNLLTMASGHDNCPMGKLFQGQDFVQGFLEDELAFEPGSTFIYNSAATYMLAAVIRKTTGMNVLDFLQERLFLPIGIRAEKWDCCPAGTNLGGWGFWLKSEDLLRFGRLMLNGGCWDGKQLIPADYVKEATSFQIDNSANEQPDWKLGYGYQFWRGSMNSFRADGACGQYILVLPDHDMTVVITSGVSYMQNIMTMFWETVGAALQDQPLADDPIAEESLKKILASRELPPAGSALRPVPVDRCFELAKNSLQLKKLEFAFSAEACTVRFCHADGKPEDLVAGYGCHTLNRLTLNENEERILAASAAWQSSDQLEIQVYAVETPFRDRYYFRFSEGKLEVERIANLEFLHEPWPVLNGTLC